MSIQTPNREKSPGTFTPADVPIDALPTVELNANQIQQAMALSEIRNESYKPIDGGVVFGSQDALTSHQVGVLGELAVAEIYGIQLDIETYERRDGFDQKLLGVGIDIKTTATDSMRRPELLVRADKDLQADLYVWAHVTDWGPSGTKVRIIGVASKAKVVNRQPRKYPGDTLNYVVPPEELDFLPLLNPIEDTR